MYFPCDKFIRILIKNAQYDLYDSRSPSFWFHVAREITLVEDKLISEADRYSWAVKTLLRLLNIRYRTVTGGICYFSVATVERRNG